MRYQEHLNTLQAIGAEIIPNNPHGLSEEELHNVIWVINTLIGIIEHIDELRISLDGHCLFNNDEQKYVPFHSDNFSDNNIIRNLIENPRYEPILNNYIKQIKTAELNCDEDIEKVKSLFATGQDFIQARHYCNEAKNENDAKKAEDDLKEIKKLRDKQIREVLQSDLLRKVFLNGYNDDERERQIINATVIQFIDAYNRVKNEGSDSALKLFVAHFEGYCIESRIRYAIDFSLTIPTFSEVMNLAYRSTDNPNYFSIILTLTQEEFWGRYFSGDEFASAGYFDHRCFAEIDKFLREMLDADLSEKDLEEAIILCNSQYSKYGLRFLIYLQQIPELSSLIENVSINGIKIIIKWLGNLRNNDEFIQLFTKCLLKLPEDEFVRKMGTLTILFDRDTREFYAQLSERLFNIILDYEKTKSFKDFYNKFPNAYFLFVQLAIAEVKFEIAYKMLLNTSNKGRKKKLKKFPSIKDALFYCLQVWDIKSIYFEQAVATLLASYNENEILNCFTSSLISIKAIQNWILDLEKNLHPLRVYERWRKNLFIKTIQDKNLNYIESWLVTSTDIVEFVPYFNKLENQTKEVALNFINNNKQSILCQLFQKNDLAKSEIIAFLKSCDEMVTHAQCNDPLEHIPLHHIAINHDGEILNLYFTIYEKTSFRGDLEYLGKKGEERLIYALWFPNLMHQTPFLLALRCNNISFITTLLNNPVFQGWNRMEALQFICHDNIEQAFKIAAEKSDGISYSLLLNTVLQYSDVYGNDKQFINKLEQLFANKEYILLPWASIKNKPENLNRILKLVSSEIVLNNLLALANKNMQEEVIAILNHAPDYFKDLNLDELFHIVGQKGQHNVLNYLMKNNLAIKIDCLLSANENIYKIVSNWLEDPLIETDTPVIHKLMKIIYCFINCKHLENTAKDFAFNTKEESEIFYYLLIHPNPVWRKALFSEIISGYIFLLLKSYCNLHQNKFPHFNEEQLLEILEYCCPELAGKVIGLMTFDLDNPSQLQTYLAVFRKYYQNNPKRFPFLIDCESANYMTLLDIAIRLDLPKLVTKILKLKDIAALMATLRDNTLLDTAFYYESWKCVNLLKNNTDFYSLELVHFAYARAILKKQAHIVELLREKYKNKIFEDATYPASKHVIDAIFLLHFYAMDFNSRSKFFALKYRLRCLHPDELDEFTTTIYKSNNIPNILENIPAVNLATIKLQKTLFWLVKYLNNPGLTCQFGNAYRFDIDDSPREFVDFIFNHPSNQVRDKLKIKLLHAILLLDDIPKLLEYFSLYPKVCITEVPRDKQDLVHQIQHSETVKLHRLRIDLLATCDSYLKYIEASTSNMAASKRNFVTYFKNELMDWADITDASTLHTYLEHFREELTRPDIVNTMVSGTYSFSIFIPCDRNLLRELGAIIFASDVSNTFNEVKNYFSSWNIFKRS